MSQEWYYNKWIIFGIIVVAIIIVAIVVVYSTKKEKYGYAEYEKQTVGPNPFISVLPILKTRVYNYRNEFVIYETLEKALQNAQPYEKIAVVSLDNPKEYTRPLQDIPQVMKFIAPYMEQMLSLRGLKLARNPNDQQIVYKFVESEGYSYPVGLWLYVAKESALPPGPSPGPGPRPGPTGPTGPIGPYRR